MKKYHINHLSSDFIEEKLDVQNLNDTLHQILTDLSNCTNLQKSLQKLQSEIYNCLKIFKRDKMYTLFRASFVEDAFYDFGQNIDKTIDHFRNGIYFNSYSKDDYISVEEELKNIFAFMNNDMKVEEFKEIVLTALECCCMNIIGMILNDKSQMIIQEDEDIKRALFCLPALVNEISDLAVKNLQNMFYFKILSESLGEETKEDNLIQDKEMYPELNRPRETYKIVNDSDNLPRLEIIQDGKAKWYVSSIQKLIPCAEGEYQLDFQHFFGEIRKPIQYLLSFIWKLEKNKELYDKHKTEIDIIRTQINLIGKLIDSIDDKHKFYDKSIHEYCVKIEEASRIAFMHMKALQEDINSELCIVDVRDVAEEESEEKTPEGVEE